LDNVNPFLLHLRHAFATVGNIPFALELQSHPVGREIAAIIHGNNLTEIHPKSIVVWHKGGTSSHHVSILSELYEPLQYPLSFPHGTPWWGQDSELSQIWWYRIRILNETRFRMFGRLFNEYLVDMYCRVEDQRLDYIRRGRLHHLNQLRAQMEAQTHDSNSPEDVLNDANCTAAEAGFLLPSSFLGSRA
jgi:hypothetical protein